MRWWHKDVSLSCWHHQARSHLRLGPALTTSGFSAWMAAAVMCCEDEEFRTHPCLHPHPARMLPLGSLVLSGQAGVPALLLPMARAEVVPAHCAAEFQLKELVNSSRHLVFPTSVTAKT